MRRIFISSAAALAAAALLTQAGCGTNQVTTETARPAAAVAPVSAPPSQAPAKLTFNEHIQGEDFLDTAKFPSATFKSTKVVFEGDKPATIEGNLTIKGVTKPVSLKVTSYTNMEHPMLKKDVIGADASVVIKRSEFKAGKYSMTEEQFVAMRRIDEGLDSLTPGDGKK